ncbi:ABC transporter permease [Nocardioides anomalus]|uniref:ABC transporter permease n=1 Tax=Nocardioides anomalus TaxID=2712223 RepID=A0A6G6W9V2_9ACTN|nr:ABC transporter permease [Nocardioides anomalus]QIG42002.1 ABC transporter permease [Nocardioides anomalus]
MSKLRFWVEVALSVLSGLALVLTLVWEEWIEEVFGVEPDGGDGSAEWLVFLVLAVLAVGSGVLARVEWRRLTAAGAA